MKLRDACVIFFLSGVMDIDVFQFFSLLPYQRFGNDFLSKPRSTQRWGGGDSYTHTWEIYVFEAQFCGVDQISVSLKRTAEGMSFLFRNFDHHHNTFLFCAVFFLSCVLLHVIEYCY